MANEYPIPPRADLDEALRRVHQGAALWGSDGSSSTVFLHGIGGGGSGGEYAVESPSTTVSVSATPMKPAWPPKVVMSEEKDTYTNHRRKFIATGSESELAAMLLCVARMTRTEVADHERRLNETWLSQSSTPNAYPRGWRTWSVGWTAVVVVGFLCLIVSLVGLSLFRGG